MTFNPSLLNPNPGKKLIVEIEGEKWLRLPIKTHFITVNDKIDEIIKKYVLPLAKEKDIIVLGQKIVSILQGRLIYKKDLKLGFWARFLSQFAKKTPYGFSVGNPLKMQVAINSAGLPRILLVSFLAGILKIFRVYGIFYRLAGNQINQLDGFYGEAFPEYAEIGILGPVGGVHLCQRQKEKYGFSFAMADVNDLGGNILGRSRDLKGKENLLLKILKDNPAGQGAEKTPILILRKL
ncbi:F420-0--gamma-glutamyl ligase [Patescibacteria group bacterium]|nr:F420-0--gamma-glutamyl ligase [Patescibacteria group bacterium]MBU4481288.1 F420-0--gamma-glutamyl ligase [Patescibacteria group bacterium]